LRLAKGRGVVHGCGYSTVRDFSGEVQRRELHPTQVGAQGTQRRSSQRRCSQRKFVWMNGNGNESVSHKREKNEEKDAEEVSLMDMFMHMFREHVLQPDVQRELFRPLLKWFLWNLMPYVLLFIGLNFFTTLAAVALVFFSVRNKKML